MRLQQTSEAVPAMINDAFNPSTYAPTREIAQVVLLGTIHIIHADITHESDQIRCVT